ncbi:MAG: DNA polymerase III subunit chi [Pseudomonadota bacterium]|nr:DNA polymerase III subunit chi [Pseudomonadota bacterium]
MKSTVNFYSLEKSQDLHLSVCTLIRELYKLGGQIIICDFHYNLEKIDKLLWTFEQNSFLPHKIYEPKVTLDTPILLLTEKYLNNLLIFKEYDSLINNFDEPIIQAENHFKVYEFVESSEEKKIISRKKYTIYKNNNFDLNHKKYNG